MAENNEAQNDEQDNADHCGDDPGGGPYVVPECMDPGVAERLLAATIHLDASTTTVITHASDLDPLEDASRALQCPSCHAWGEWRGDDAGALCPSCGRELVAAGATCSARHAGEAVARLLGAIAIGHQEVALDDLVESRNTWGSLSSVDAEDAALVAHELVTALLSPSAHRTELIADLARRLRRGPGSVQSRRAAVVQVVSRWRGAESWRTSPEAAARHLRAELCTHECGFAGLDEADNLEWLTALMRARMSRPGDENITAQLALRTDAFGDRATPDGKKGQIHEVANKFRKALKLRDNT